MPSRKPKPVINIWTDGSVEKQQGRGGWGVVLEAPVRGKTVHKEFSGVIDAPVTSQRMELVAAVCGIARVQGAQKIRLHSDSKYLINNIKKNHAKYERGLLETIPNGDIWRELVECDLFHEIEWVKVKGHAGDENNEIAHRRAYEAWKNAEPETVAEVAEAKGIRSMELAESPFPEINQWIVDSVTDPRKIRALNPETGEMEEGRLINLLGGVARVLFDSEEVSTGYGQGGRSQRYAPTRDVPEYNVEVIK